MRIVAVSDTHFAVDPSRIPDGDVFIHSGDLMYTGYIDEWHRSKDWLAALPHKHKYLIPGNHDFHIQNYEGVARAELRKECGVRTILPGNPIFKLPNGMTGVGCSYVTGLAGWAFGASEEDLERWLNALPESPDIMVTHAPPFGILDAIYPNEAHVYKQEHVGSLAFNRWFYRRKDAGEHIPLLWFCGHIHESYGHMNVGGTQFYNTAMCDRKYEQSNEPVVVDV